MARTSVYVSVGLVWLQSASQSAPTILKNRAPWFLKNRVPCFLQKAGWKKQGHSLFKKRRDQAASSLFELQWPWFLHSVFFKKQGAWFLRIVGADWLGDFLTTIILDAKHEKIIGDNEEFFLRLHPKVFVCFSLGWKTLVVPDDFFIFRILDNWCQKLGLGIEIHLLMISATDYGHPMKA